MNIGIWNTELQDPNEIISIWSHPNIESMSKYWRDLDEIQIELDSGNIQCYIIKM